MPEEPEDLPGMPDDPQLAAALETYVELSTKCIELTEELKKQRVVVINLMKDAEIERVPFKGRMFEVRVQEAKDCLYVRATSKGTEE